MPNRLRASIVSNTAEQPRQAVTSLPEETLRPQHRALRRPDLPDQVRIPVESPWVSSEDVRVYLRQPSRAASWVWCKRHAIRCIRNGRKVLWLKADVERVLANGGAVARHDQRIA